MLSNTASADFSLKSPDIIVIFSVCLHSQFPLDFFPFGYVPKRSAIRGNDSTYLHAESNCRVLCDEFFGYEPEHRIRTRQPSHILGDSRHPDYSLDQSHTVPHVPLSLDRIDISHYCQTISVLLVVDINIDIDREQVENFFSFQRK